MERFEVDVIIREGEPGNAVKVAPALLERLGAQEHRPLSLRFGTRRVEGRLEGEPGLPPGQVLVPAPIAERLGLPGATRMSIWREGGAALAFGPLIGYVTSRAVLQDLRAGEAVPPYIHMGVAAREAGGVLILFSPSDIRWEQGRVRGERIEVAAGATARVASGWFPLPRVILYPQALEVGPTPRQLAARVRSLGAVVLSHRKIRKLETYAVLRRVPELRRYLPRTARLTRETLARALRRSDDLYLKPDDLSRGRGVHRLRRRAGGWRLTYRRPAGNVNRFLPDLAAVHQAVAPLLRARSVYLIQEGLPLATFLGNRFDMRALVQKDGQGRWVVSGVVARIAPEGSAITSPRSGGLVALPEQVLRHAFGERGSAVLTEVKEAALAIARAIDAALGPRYELGIDLGVLQDGTVRLIEVNGMPLKVSLHRLGDPFAEERINRYPVHYAAWLDIGGIRR